MTQLVLNSFISHILLFGSIFSQSILINEYHLDVADSYELPDISPRGDLVTVMASSDYDGIYLMLIDLNNLNKKPQRLSKLNNKKKRKRGLRSVGKIEEFKLGWSTVADTQYLYTATNQFKQNDIITQIHSHTFKYNTKHETFLELKNTFESNSPNTSLFLNNDDGIIISFLNARYIAKSDGVIKDIHYKKGDIFPYGYSYFSFDDEGGIRTSKLDYLLPGPVQSISQWNNDSVLILEGRENIYNIWIAKKVNDWFPRALDINLFDYSAILNVNCHPFKNIFSFSSLTEDIENNIGELCIYDLDNNVILKKISIHIPSEPYKGSFVSQWSQNKLYFLKQNTKEHIELYYYDLLTKSISKSNISDKRIKSFKISDKGDIIVLNQYPNGGHIRIYKLNE